MTRASVAAVSSICRASMPAVLLRNGKGVIVYPNPLVADLIVSAIANRIAELQDHRVEPNADIMRAFARLERELDELADAVQVSIAFLEARGFADLQAMR